MSYFSSSFTFLVNDFTTFQNKNICLIDRKAKNQNLYKRKAGQKIFVITLGGHCPRRQGLGLSATLGTLVLYDLRFTGVCLGTGHPLGPQVQGNLGEAHCEDQYLH